MQLHELVEEYETKTTIRTPSDVYREMRDIKSWEREAFVCLCLDSQANIISREIISIGTLNYCVIHPRDVFRTAITRNANSVIIAHNHPSGALEPSKQDIEVTKSVKYAGEIIGIKLQDHVIVTKNGYYSMSTEGDM